MPITLDTIILDIMGAIQTINSTIATVQAPQPAQYPTAIDTTNGQPFAMTVSRGGEAWQKGAGYSQGVHTFGVLVYIDPVAQSDIPSHEVAGAQLVQKFINKFILSTNTPLFNPGAYQATIESGPDGPHISYSGIVPTLSFGGRAYYGAEIRVPVRWQGSQV